MEELLEQGAPVDERDERNRTALTVAVARGDEETLKVLLAHGASKGGPTHAV